MKQNKNNEGIAHIVIMLLIGAVALIIVASAGAYYFLKLKGQQYVPAQPVQTYNSVSQTPPPISKSDKTTDIQKDLNTTIVNPVDTDLNKLDAASKSL